MNRGVGWRGELRGLEEGEAGVGMFCMTGE